MEIEKLKQIGFSDLDIKIYEYILKKGEVNKKNLLEELNINSKDLEESISRLLQFGSIEIIGDTIVLVSPKIFLNKFLKIKELEFESKLVELKRIISELQNTLEQIYIESKYGIRLEELWQPIENLKEMEVETIKLISRAKNEISILTERFSYYPRIREELISAVDRNVEVKVLFLTFNKEIEDRIKELKMNKIKVRISKGLWRNIRFTIVDKKEAVFLIWAKKERGERIYYRPGYTKNQGMIEVLLDTFQYLWNIAEEIK
jgi:sugar-specific transcriptional regulator TrmB